jgi:hypothetical protein
MKNRSKAFYEVKHLNWAVWLLSVFMLYSQFLFAQSMRDKKKGNGIKSLAETPKTLLSVINFLNFYYLVNIKV